MMVSIVNNDPNPPNSIPLWWQEVKRDLSPFEGRWEQSWRIALLCALMTLISMTYGIPAAVLSCYVLFFVMKSDAAESMVLAVALVTLVSIVVFVLIGLINLTIDSPVARLVVIVVSSILFLFLGTASALGPLGGIIALVIAFVMTLLVYIPIGELATRAVLYAWLITSAPMGLLIIFSLAFGRKPKDVLVGELSARLELAAQSLEQQVSIEVLRQDLALGIETQQKRLKWLGLFHLAPKATQQYLGVAIIQTYKLLLATLLLAKQEPSLAYPELAMACRAVALSLRKEQVVDLRFNELYISQSLPDEIRSILITLNNASKAESTHDFVMPEEKSSFFLDDAFTNPTYQRTAVKATGAAVLCYLIYSGIGWEGIHTAMITCYVATLGSTGETVNKLFLRIVGCLIGASLGLILIFVFIAHMTSIGALMIAVFLVSLLAAWVSLGTERVSYAGIQIAFAFLLISLDGFGPTIDVSTAWDRIVGVLLGNLMMYVIFTHIWPQSVMHSVERRVTTIEKKLQKLAILDNKEAVSIAHAASIAQELHEANYEFSLVMLEPKSLRPEAAILQQYQQQLKAYSQRFEQLALGLAAPS